ncbi:MAG: hypothetical protein AB1451_01640 [Nitrospirota bacterium]
MSVIETTKELMALVQKLDNVDLIKKLVDLAEQCRDLVLENGALKERVGTLEQALATQQTLQYRNNAYWLTDKDDEQSGPFCSTCWDAKRLTIRMVRGIKGYGHCNNCDKTVQYGETDPPPARVPGRNWVRGY